MNALCSRGNMIGGDFGTRENTATTNQKLDDPAVLVVQETAATLQIADASIQTFANTRAITLNNQCQDEVVAMLR